MSVLMARGIVQLTPGPAPDPILNGVNLDLETGVTALLGPNGSGKTTLLRTLAGLLPPEEGHVEVDDVALQDHPERIRRLVGYLPQFPGVYQRLTVAQHFERQHLWLERQGLRPSTLRDVLERFGLSAVRHDPAGRLSLRDRRGLAMALLWARRCRVLLLDEPTAGLDPEDRLRFWNLVMDFLRDPEGPGAVLVTTHLMAEAEAYAQHALVLVEGLAAFQGTVDRLTARAEGRAVSVEGPPPAGMLEVGVDVLSGDHLGLLGGRIPPPTDETPTLHRRRPRLLDGYLAVVMQAEREARARRDPPRIRAGQDEEALS
jgi:ABC-2 type transport system ATP-binding protein